MNGHVVGHPLFGENINNLSERKEKNSEIEVIGIYPTPPPSTQGFLINDFFFACQDFCDKPAPI